MKDKQLNRQVSDARKAWDDNIDECLTSMEQHIEDLEKEIDDLEKQLERAAYRIHELENA